ncbi:hypothetical protein CVT24_000477 [Panaeolus cyanescens]|uniref:chitin deacetylase n=1 Tax=Panaeolus cyanescens TaxID=181874 RepID=A0A409V8D1_9AGAR|nr:hypothetical protein CVT24_000477 [Panaeolus cyanescens]
MSSGTKRASPGADEGKSPIDNVELSDENAKKLQDIQRDLARVELVLERQAQAALRPVYEKRRALALTIPNFWPVALMNNSIVALHCQHNADQTALSYLEDVWVEKDPKEHRCFTLEFHFKENQFFSDRVLKKEYKYIPPPAADSDTPDENGITQSMLDFSWERDVEASGTPINWKDADKALTKLYPREVDEYDEDGISDPGSFFNFFESKNDPDDMGLIIANEVFPEAIEWFLGNAEGIDDDSDIDSEDEDSEAEEIDLEKPRTKKLSILPVFVVAHGADTLNHARRHHEPRQAPPLTPSAPAQPSQPGVPAPLPPSPPVSGTATGTLGAPTPSTPTISVSLLATNPTAIPLASIVSTEPSSVTKPLDSTAVPGSTPTLIPGAPPLPNPALLAPAAYPSLDRQPPIDSPEVQQWIQDVANTGVVIPDIPPTNPGGCPNNTDAAADSSRCWWTCGGCTRTSDITECPTALDWGLTYDDGPAFYTSNLLSYLDQVNLKSTFFVVGSRVISYPATLQTQYASGHQIAVHTWSHPALTTLTNEQIIAELGWSKKAIKDVLGVTPNMMRPPFGDIDDRVRAISIAMGLQPVMWTRISPLATFDTDDFNIKGGTTTVQQVLQNWQNILGNATTRDTGFIVLEHDLWEQTVEVATGYILPDALAHTNPKFNIRPVVTCLNRDLKDAYIETNDNSTNPPPIQIPGAVTTTAVRSSQTGGSTGHTGAAVSAHSGMGGAVGSAMVAGLALLTGGRLIQW